MIKLFIANLKMMVRGKQALFWALVFPLMFTIIFGFFFGSGSTSAGTIALIDSANTPLSQAYAKALEDSKLVKIKTDVALSDINDQIAKSQLAAAVEIPKGFGSTGPDATTNIKIIEDPANGQVNGALSAFTNQFLIQTDYKIHNLKPTFSVTEETTNKRTLTYFDFVLMGLIGLALMNASVQGIAIAMANYREDQILKRLTTTPLKTWKFVGAEVLSRLVLNILQVGLILAIGIWGFHAHVYGNILLIFIFALLGGLLFQSLGFLVASVAKTTDAAQGMAVAITIPMMFLAGVFFPIDSLPKWLSSVIQYLPLAPLLRMIRTIGLEAGSPFTNPLNIEIVLAWILVALGISIWRFRLTDE